MKAILIITTIAFIRILKIKLLLKEKIRIKMKEEKILSGNIIYPYKLETQKFLIKLQL